MKKLYYKVSAVMLAVLMCFSVLLPEHIPKANAATEVAATLTNHGTQWYTCSDSNGNVALSGCGKFTVNGITAICCEHAKSQPASGTVVYQSVIENAELAKALYYGTVEKVKWSGFTSEAHAIVVTSLLIDNIYNGTSHRWQTADFRAFLATQPPAPTPYIFFYRTASTSYQDLIGYNPKFEQGTISVKKTDPSGKGLAGAVFNAKNVLTGAEFDIGPTDSSGYAITKQIIPYGTYIVEETTAPAGYKLSTETWTVTVSPENNGAASFTAINEPNTGSIKGYKVDPSGNKLAGAEIGLFNDAGQDKTHTATTGDAYKTAKTGADGIFEFLNVPIGKYYLKEITAPSGYVRDKAWYRDVEITTAGQVVVVDNIVNTPNVGSVQIVKTSSDGQYFARDIEFTLTGGNLTAPLKGKTDTNGKLLFSDLAPGTYTVTETVPDKYKPQAPQTVTVKSGETATVNFANIVKTGTVKGKKVDHLGNPLAGAQIGIFPSWVTTIAGNEAVQRVITGANGVFEFKDIPYGEYFVAELYPPSGYIWNTTRYPVTISENGAVIEIDNIVNEPAPKGITILKTDTYSNVLADCEFTLETSNDNGATWETVTSATTDETGTVTFSELIPGTYYRITETKTLEGFQLLKEPIFEGQLSVADKEVITITTINAPEFELPPTGGNSFLYVPIGIGLAMGAVIVIYYLLKKERRGKEI